MEEGNKVPIVAAVAVRSAGGEVGTVSLDLERNRTSGRKEQNSEPLLRARACEKRYSNRWLCEHG
jgi:hypothetical protein